MRYLYKSVQLLIFGALICCVIYPLALWAVGQTFFPFQSNGSMLKGPDGKYVGSKLIAQPFTKDEYFWPRPSAASMMPPLRLHRALRRQITSCATGLPARWRL